ncbi:D,D-heptose 1,7-bisphosphate phosphatase [Candidatus Blochmanniella chromaiodes str. 640]|uniref:D,D-heptose 1,7-bisphosphate phosphatase n=1 Tax=Candidatus Blochmanniella chromaiodes str. 640 TaxID=1240471 RepID=A0ABN4AY80_9ENTR|nr:D-glycero-beta-D-manno-heptose 1,7-bisphosphate 7-phosphatase [Candidatus Blochmannia chromaiodes]AGC03571.1 D,D-heptose 1,7-bisphosphate phosphatase [Candidatus Blochmannia chromaiodes str. 640]
MNNAIFMDRDGTINIDKNYVHNIDNFFFIDNVIDAMVTLKEMNFFLIIVTNQSGIARGLFTQNDFLLLTKWMIAYLGMYYHVYIDAIYFCPHHTQGIMRKFQRACLCRKPNPGMLLDAKKRFNINMITSYMVGDTENDMLAGQLAGIGTKVLVCSGKKITKKTKKTANWVIESLAFLPNMIRTQHGYTKYTNVF